MGSGRPSFCPEGRTRTMCFIIPDTCKAAFLEFCKSRFLSPSQAANQALQRYEDGMDFPNEIMVGQPIRISLNICPEIAAKLQAQPNKSGFAARALASYMVSQK